MCLWTAQVGYLVKGHMPVFIYCVLFITENEKESLHTLFILWVQS